MLSLLPTLALGFGYAGLAYADTCADHVKSAVEEQASVDFPTSALDVEVPPFQAGGRVQLLDVPVMDAAQSGVELAVYVVMIDEVCAVEIQTHH